MANMKIEDAYFELHALATCMKEALELARHTENYAPKFKATVEAIFQSTIDDFNELSKSLPIPEAKTAQAAIKAEQVLHNAEAKTEARINQFPINFLANKQLDERMAFDDKKAMQSVSDITKQFPDSGALSALSEGQGWLDAAEIAKKEGHVEFAEIWAETGERWIALLDAQRLQCEEGKTYGVERFPPVRRLAENLLLYKDKVYSYEPEMLNSESEDLERSAVFKLHIGKAPFDFPDECGQEIKHIGTVRALTAFLGAENAYPCPVSLGEKLIDRKTGNEFVVGNISNEQIMGADGNGNEFHMQGASLLKTFSSPRLDAEVATLVQSFEKDWTVRNALINQTQNKAPSNDTPAP